MGASVFRAQVYPSDSAEGSKAQAEQSEGAGAEPADVGLDAMGRLAVRGRGEKRAIPIRGKLDGLGAGFGSDRSMGTADGSDPKDSATIRATTTGQSVPTTFIGSTLAPVEISRTRGAGPGTPPARRIVTLGHCPTGMITPGHCRAVPLQADDRCAKFQRAGRFQTWPGIRRLPPRPEAPAA
jgi:hypothetical protein